MDHRRRTKQLIALALLGALAFVQAAHAQRFAADSRNYFDFGDQSYISVRQFPAADSVVVYVNTANALFSFVRADRALSARGEYYAVRDLAVELRESPAGKVLVTNNVRDTIFAADFSATTSKERWNIKAISVPLRQVSLPQAAEIHTEIRDGFLSRLADRPSSIVIQLRSFSRSRAITARDSSFIGIGDPVFFDANSTGCINCWRAFGNTTEFSRDIAGMVPLAFGDKESCDSISISLVQDNDFLKSPKFQKKNISQQRIAPSDLVKGQALVLAGADSIVSFSMQTRIDTGANTGVNYALAPFVLKAEPLEMGSYHLDITAYRSGYSRTIRHEFELTWHDMPLSLDNARDAITPMQYILTDSEFEKLSMGSNADEMRKLFEYWKTVDPTPATAFNERMSEFYHRADYAYFNFARNPRQLDGAMTDRGKIYILFGPPTNIQRSFLVGEQPMEIWTYANNVKKIFKFLSQGGNEFKLAEVKPM